MLLLKVLILDPQGLWELDNQIHLHFSKRSISLASAVDLLSYLSCSVTGPQF